MSVPVLIGFAGVLVAAVATGMLAGRCARQPRLDLILWTATTLGLTVALAAESMGFASGFGPATFRAVQLFAVLLAPLWLAWGLVELVAGSEAARFGMRLLSSALTVVAGVILATDPLSTQAFSKSWPLASLHYQAISHYMLDVVQVVAVIAAVAAAGLGAARARNDQRPLAVLAGIAAVVLAVLFAVALRFSLPTRSLYPLLSMMAAALVWFAATSLAGRLARPGRARDARGARSARGGRAGPPSRSRRGDSESNGYGAPGEFGDRDGWVDPDGWVNPSGWADTDGREREPQRDRGVTAAARGPVTGVLPADGRPRRPGPQAPDPRAPDPRAPDPRVPDLAAPVFGGAGAGFGGHATTTASPEDAPAAKPYGRILIFTLLDDRVADFDRLAEQSAEQVRISEPDTLVYVIHLVPNAPMQRIFYEIYRDRAAFDRHESQPYMQRFVADRRSLVLATNVIELRLKYAKVAPLPNPAAAEPAAPAAPRAQLPPGPGWGPPVPQSLQPLPPARTERRYGG